MWKRMKGRGAELYQVVIIRELNEFVSSPLTSLLRRLLVLVLVLVLVLSFSGGI